MINDMLKSIDQIYIAYGATDFRKQAGSLCNMVINTYHMDPYKKAAYIFCNKKRDSIKVLCYDKNGFVLAQKSLLNSEKMKFCWPRNSKEIKQITKRQLEWLLSGLKLEQKRAFKEIKINIENSAS